MSTAGFFNKCNNCINRFLSLFAVVWAINCGMLNTGYCGTQFIKFSPFFLGQIPLYQISLLRECGYDVSKGFFSAFKSANNQLCAANLITPASQKSQKSSLSVGNSTDSFAVNVEPVRDNHGQNATESHSADGFASCKERLNYLWWHFVSGLLGGLIALAIWRRTHP